MEIELSMKRPSIPQSIRMRRAQRGVTLIIALIVLVAMTLAGVAMMRSVDTGTLVAGNLAFRQSTVHSADQGIQAAYTYLSANSGGTRLYYDDNALGTSSKGYFSSWPLSAPDPDWMDSANWNNAAVVNGGLPDAGGNVVYYMIHRLCACGSSAAPGIAPRGNCLAVTGGANICAQTPDDATGSGEGREQRQADTHTQTPATHYRITAKAVGPRNSVTIVQTLVRAQ